MKEFDPTLPIEKLKPQLSRADWQRTVGVAIVNSIIGDAFDEPVTITAQECKRIAWKLSQSELSHGLNLDTQHYLVESAHMVADLAVTKATDFTSARQSMLQNYTETKISSLRESLWNFTHYRDIAPIFSEAMSSLAHFPINLLSHVIVAARNHEPQIEKYEIENLSDIGRHLQSTDFRTMISQASVAHNGFWAHYSTAPNPSYNSPLASPTHDAFEFTTDSVCFSPSALRTMRHGITQNNRASINRGENTNQDVSEMSSSGCPARHLAPAPNARIYSEQLSDIAAVLGVHLDNVVAPRKQSTINSGINVIATALDQASGYFDTLCRRRERGNLVMLGSELD